MLTIEVSDLSNLSQVQREALSAFILDRAAAVDARDSAPKRMAFPNGDRWLASEPKSPEVELSPEAAFAPAIGDVSTPLIPQVPQVTAPGTDKSGLPWDERIHSSSKNLTADGLWRKKRGVPDGRITEIEGQLKALMGAPDAAPSAIIPPPPPAPTPIAAIPPPPPPVVDMDARQAYIKLVGRASTAMQEQKLSKEEIQQILEKWGVPTLALLMTARPDLIPSVAMDLEALIVTR